MLDFLIIANPSAGRGRAVTVAGQAAAYLRRQGATVRVVKSPTANGILDPASKACEQEPGCLVACGGDGTVQRLLPLALERELLLGFLPCGRGTDWARALGIPRVTPAQAELLLRDVRRRIVLGRVTLSNHDAPPPYFGIALACGFDAAVATYAYAHPMPFTGLPAYLYALLRVLQYYRSPSMRLEGEQVEHDGPFFLATLANYHAYGGGWQIAPAARINDGLLDLCLMQPISRWTALRLLPRVLRGTHEDHPAVSFHQSRWFSIEGDQALPLYADGEPVGMTPARVEVVPDALQVIAGEA